MSLLKNHPKGLALLFMTEMWERFSYYGMRALLFYYMVGKISEGGLGMSTIESGKLFGLYTGLIYVTPLIGGWVADKFLGNRICIIIGASLMMFGHISLAFDSIELFYVGLCLLIIGNGFFKPNISSMVGLLYPEGSKLKDAGYILFYMGINVGATFGTLTCGYLGEHLGWHYGFGAAGVGMLVGLAGFSFFQSYLGNIGLKPKPIIVPLGDVIIPQQALTKEEKGRLWVIGILSFFSIVFWLAFEQAGSSLSLFALNFTDRHFDALNFTFPASWLQSINPILILCFAPMFSYIWSALAGTKYDLSGPMKFVCALILLGAGFAFLAWGARNIPAGSASAQVSFIWLMGAYILHTIGELFLSPVGMSYVNKLSPKTMVSLMFGVWLFASAIGNYIGGAMAGYVEVISKENSIGYFFGLFVWISWGAALVLFLIKGKLEALMYGIK